MSERLMEAIEKGDAPFAYIPTEIGELKFCCTDNERKQPYSKEGKRKKTYLLDMWVIIIPILFLAIFNNSPIIDIVSKGRKEAKRKTGPMMFHRSRLWIL